jgi:hypothetical protein
MSRPASDAWPDVLHWCLRQMATDDPDLAFAASLLSYALRGDGLTEKQARYATRIADRVSWQVQAGSVSAPSPKPQGTLH